MRQQTEQTKFRTSIGGQALIEGILMRGPRKQAIVVRDPQGELVVKTEELKLIRENDRQQYRRLYKAEYGIDCPEFK